MQQLANTLDDLDNPLSAVIAMYNLEEEGSADVDVLDSNQVVLHQNDNFIDCAFAAAGNQPPAAQCPAPGGFSDEIWSSLQNLDDVDQLEQFLYVAADVKDADDVSRSVPAPYAAAVAAVEEKTRYNTFDASSQVRSSVASLGVCG